MNLNKLEPIFLRMPHGLKSQFRIFFFKLLGITIGYHNRFEKGRLRRLSQIQIGSNNAFSQGFYLWPLDGDFDGKRITIGNNNYFNKNCMIDACGGIEIGSFNMFGPDVYITDSNHTFGNGLPPSQQPMQVGNVKIGNNCWLGAKVVILKGVELGDNCIVGAGAVVTKSFEANSVIMGVPAKLKL